MELGVFEPRNKSKTRISCSVYGCSSKSHINLDLRFHAFPKKNAHFIYMKNFFGEIEKIELVTAWKKALRIGKDVNKHPYVCSLHFRKDDYFLPYVASQKRRLKITSVPSCNLPRSSIETSRKNEKLRIEREERHRKRASKLTEKKIERTNPTEDETILIDVLEDTDHENTNHLCNEVETIAEPKSEPQIELSQDIGVQVNSDFILPKFTEFITTDSQLNTATGIETMDILETIVDIAKAGSDDNFKRSGGRLNLRDKILMVYIKLKQNISFAFLAILFNGYTVKHCQRIFLETLSLLSQCLRVAIVWRSKEEIARNTPKCFDNFKDIRVILEYTRILVQQPAELFIKDSASSRYGSSDTYKIITGLTPAGNFSFISEPFGSKKTDDEMFEQSDIISLLEPGDAVMIDKGSKYIEDLCKSNHCKCIRPPPLKSKKYFTESDTLLTANIAKARAHIKRSNLRIKTFKIVSDKIPTKLVPHVHEIVTVICATLNLSSPIVTNGEFIVIEQLSESDM